MRFLDWDVLLFPIPEDGHHIPFQEFRTACYTEAGPRSLIPLMVTYVPSIQPGSDFQISLHSWSPTTPLYEPAPDGSRPKEVWQVRVVVDGLQLVVAHLPIDGSWPRLIAGNGDAEHKPESPPLRFPVFHNELMAAPRWSASDVLGRIRVELSAGWIDNQTQLFHPGVRSVHFAFQHAPLNILEQCNIAWPNHVMYASAGGGRPPPPRAPAITYPRVNSRGTTEYKPIVPKPSGNSGLPAAASMLPPPQPIRRNGNVVPCNGLVPGRSGRGNHHSNNDHRSDSSSSNGASSRSSGACTSVGDTLAPLIRPHGISGIDGSQPYGQAAGSREDRPFRLSSDQLQRIVNAVQTDTQASLQKFQQAPGSNQIMAPPPRPTISATTPPPSDDPKPILGSATQTAEDSVPGNEIAPIEKRTAPHRGPSDVSMHTSCPSFTDSTHEDGTGHVPHDSNATATDVVRGKNKGSSPTPRTCSPPAPKPTVEATRTHTATAHNYFDTILSTTEPPTQHDNSETGSVPAPPPAPATATSPLSSSPADVQGKKRTRRALKHPSISATGSSEAEPNDLPQPPRKVSRAAVSATQREKEDGRMTQGKSSPAAE